MKSLISKWGTYKLIRDEPLLWKQMDGPQANALIYGNYEYEKALFDPLLDYYNNLSLETANSDHLTQIGRIMGVRRPMMYAPGRYTHLFRFTHDPHHEDPETGFSEVGNQMDGGFLEDTSANEDDTLLVPLDTESYRKLLLTVAHSEGELGSIRLIDDIAYAFCGQYYTLEWLHDGYPQRLFLYLTSPNLTVYSIMKSLSEGLWAPIPGVLVDMAY
jgi:hypothetical protein